MLLSIACWVVTGVILILFLRRSVLFFYHRQRMIKGYGADRIASAVYLLGRGYQKASDFLLKILTTQTTTLDGRYRYLTEHQYKSAKILVAIQDERVLQPLMAIVEDADYMTNCIRNERDELDCGYDGLVFVTKSLWQSFRELLQECGKFCDNEEVQGCIEKSNRTLETLHDTENERRLLNAQRHAEFNKVRYYDRNTESEELRES